MLQRIKSYLILNLDKHNLFLLLILATSYNASSQDQPQEMPAGYYAVVGSFVNKSNAVRYHVAISESGTSSNVGFSKADQIYYVFTTNTLDRSECLRSVVQLRALPSFSDAWLKEIGEKNHLEDSDLIVASAPSMDSSITITEEQRAAISPSTFSTDSASSQLPNLNQKDFFFSLYNAANDRVVEGKVQIVDERSAQLIQEVEGNSYLQLSDPGNKRDNLILICDAFGYRKLQREISFKNPVNDSTADFVDDMGTSILVNFDLVKYHRGDIRTLYSVYFYNDASVLRSESKFELNQLLNMLNENPGYKIRLHGHTNGNSFGKIIKPAPKELFDINSKEVKESTGSAKSLAFERAKTIKDYLVMNGIVADRVDVKSWGGKKPLFDKNGANARKNVRVEVEIISE